MFIHGLQHLGYLVDVSLSDHPVNHYLIDYVVQLYH